MAVESTTTARPRRLTRGVHESLVRLFAFLATVVAQVALAEPPRVAGLTTAYFHNSHSDMFLSRMLEGYTLEGKGPYPDSRITSLFIEQFPQNDKGRRLAEHYKVPLFATAREALTLGGDTLAVDGVLLIAEHGVYPESDTGSTIYPKRPMFAEVARACEAAERSVPVFVDKHLADNWTDAKWIYDEAQRLKIPLMAGSSLPVTWRHPAKDTVRDKPLAEILVLSYHRLDTYGFHALEVIQCLAERRAGGETGVKQVRTLKDEAVWKAFDEDLVDRRLLQQALATYKDRPAPQDKKPEELAPNPVLFVVDYEDGLRASVITLGEVYIDWTAAWRYSDGGIESAAFWTQEFRPLMHFSVLMEHLDRFMASGKPAWPVERTLLTTGMLDALLISHRDGGRLVETPHLKLEYRSDWDWAEPPPPPPNRPIGEQ